MRIGLFLNLLDEEYQISVYKGIVKNFEKKLACHLVLHKLTLSLHQQKK